MKRFRWTVRADGTLTCGSPARERRATAIHEAGHAVVAHYLGEKVQRLVIDHVRESRGHTTTNFARRPGRLGLDPISLIVSTLAGHEAEHRAYGRPLGKLPLGDYREVMRLGLTSRTLRLAGWLARQYVRWCEADIRRVARALLLRGTLGRRAFLAALKPRRKAA